MTSSCQLLYFNLLIFSSSSSSSSLTVSRTGAICLSINTDHLFQQKPPIPIPTVFIMAILFLVLLLLSSSPPPLMTQASLSVPAIYVFGDSTVDAGNNNNIQYGVKANFYPYGIDFNNQSTGRFTNGKTAVDFMAYFLDLPPPPAYQNLSDSDRKSSTITMAGINYGSAGCGIFTTTRPNEFAECFNLEEQIGFFNGTVQQDLPSLIEDPHDRTQYLAASLFFVSVGANDYLFTYPKSDVKDPDEFAFFLFWELKICLDKLYEMGARKFMVNNIGPLGCLPSMINKTTSGQCNEDLNLLIMPYINQLPNNLKNWTYGYTDASLLLADSHGLLYQILFYPQEFGFKDVKHPCCGVYEDGELQCLPGTVPCSNRDEYLFFDAAHTSQAANHVFAQLCYNGTICN